MAVRHCGGGGDAEIESVRGLRGELGFLVSSLDALHFYVRHAFDAGLRVRARTDSEREAEHAAPFVDDAFESLKREIAAKRAKLGRLRRRCDRARAHKKFTLCGGGGGGSEDAHSQSGQSGTFLDFLRQRLSPTHALLRFLSAHRFDTEALCADLAQLTASNVVAECGRSVAQRVLESHAEWKCVRFYHHFANAKNSLSFCLALTQCAAASSAPDSASFIGSIGPT